MILVSYPGSLGVVSEPYITRVQAMGGGGGGGFKLMLLCVQAVTAKGHPKFRKAREEKTAFRL